MLSEVLGLTIKKKVLNQDSSKKVIPAHKLLKKAALNYAELSKAASDLNIVRQNIITLVGLYGVKSADKEDMHMLKEDEVEKKFAVEQGKGVASLAAVAAGAVAADNPKSIKFKQIKESAKKLAENAKKLATQVKDKAKKLFKSLIDNIKKFAKQLIDKVKDYAKNAWKYLTELSDKIVGDKIKDLQKKEGVKLAKQAAKKVGKAAVKIAARTAAVASGPVGWVVLIIWTLWDGLTDAWDTWQETGDWYKTLVAGISGLVDSLTFGLFDKETAAKVINGTVDFLKDIPKNIGKFVSDTAKAIDDIVTNNLNGVDDRFKMDDIKKEEILRQIIEEIKDKSGSALDFNGLDQNLLDAKVYKDPYKEFVELDVNLLDAQYLTNAFDNELLTAFQTGYNSLTGTYIFDKNSYWMVTRPKNNQNATILINKQTGYMININQAGSSTSIQTQDSTTNTIIINQKGN